MERHGRAAILFFMADSRKELVQQFFETLSATHRLLGNGHGSYGAEERGAKERRKPQTELLYILSRAKEMTIKQIAAAMYITSSAATQMVETLVKEGLLQRSDDPKDRRVVIVRLTSQGKTHFNNFKKSHLSQIDQALRKLSNEDLKQAIRIRRKIISEPAS